MASTNAWFVDTDQEIAATEETESTSDRAAAIVIASLVETRLTIAIKMALLDEKKIIEQLFRPSGPLGSFSVKIDLAYLMGIVTAEAYRDLVNMKNIRNMFAHDMSPVSFDTPPVSDLCKNFRLIELMMCDMEEDEVALSAPPFTLKISDYALHMASGRGRYACAGRLFVAGLDVHRGGRRLDKPLLDPWL